MLTLKEWEKIYKKMYYRYDISTQHEPTLKGFIEGNTDIVIETPPWYKKMKIRLDVLEEIDKEIKRTIQNKGD